MDISTTPQWTITPNTGFSGLKYSPSVPLPTALGPGECLIQIHAVALNYRDVAILQGAYPLHTRPGIVPCSDAVGTVIATSSTTREFKVGDRVCTVFNPAHQAGRLTAEMRKASLGNLVDGTLRKYAVFHESALVHAPKSLGIEEAATLSCAGVTAWNVLFGLKGRELKDGEWVLTQGTGGVSLFAIQIALAVGANIIATTSDAAKAEVLRAMGVEHVINYREDAEWGESAKKLTPNGEGVDHVVEVGGDTTMAQSLRAVRTEGVISVVGFLGGKDDERKASFVDCISTLAIVRGMSVGPREQFRACNEFIDRHGIKPIVDSRVFEFEEAPDAFRYLWDKKQVGKVVIRIGE